MAEADAVTLIKIEVLDHMVNGLPPLRTAADVFVEAKSKDVCSRSSMCVVSAINGDQEVVTCASVQSLPLAATCNENVFLTRAQLGSRSEM